MRGIVFQLFQFCSVCPFLLKTLWLTMYVPIRRKTAIYLVLESYLRR